MDGFGQLETFHRGAQGLVRKSGFANGAARKAISEGVISEAISNCRNIFARDCCVVVASSVGEVSRSGQESSLFKCAYSNDEALFYAPEGNRNGAREKVLPSKRGAWSDLNGGQSV